MLNFVNTARRASEVSNERFVKIKHEQDVLRVPVMTEGTKICDRSFRAEERWEKLPKKTSNRSLPRHQSEDSKVHLQNLFANSFYVSGFMLQAVCLAIPRLGRGGMGR